jgi:hypothetical protein
MIKTLLTIVFSALLISSAAFVQNVSAQTGDGGFYSAGFLRSDYKQVDVVLHVDVKEYELVNSIGTGDCKDSSGGGYCLYRLKAEVMEVFKGKIKKQNFAFYTVLEASTGKKDFLLGEKIVFLEWSSNFPDKKRGLGTLENSTRKIESGVLGTMRKIAKRKR